MSTFTDHGTRVRPGYDWMPLAMANGVEWARDGRRFEQLYTKRLSICAALWAFGFALRKCGALRGALYPVPDPLNATIHDPRDFDAAYISRGRP